MKTKVVGAFNEYPNAHYHGKSRKLFLWIFFISRALHVIAPETVFFFFCFFFSTKILIFDIYFYFSTKTYDAQHTKKTLIQFVDSIGPGQHAHPCSLI